MHIEMEAMFPHGRWNEVVLYKGEVYQYIWTPGRKSYSGTHIWTKLEVREIK